MEEFTEYRYEIIWITNPADIQAQAPLVDAFFTLYEDPTNFPDPDEREEPSFIRDRIVQAVSAPHTHLMAYQLISPAGNRQLAAGCIVEFYPDSACALITYLFVDQHFRGVPIGPSGQKIAESLIQTEVGLVGLVRLFSQRYGQCVRAVLFESNNPALTDPEMDSMPPAKRLAFFSRLGARRIAFDYIQPPLGDDKGLVTNLFLLTFPWLTDLTDSIPILVVLSFVMELARSLDQNKEPQSSSLYGEDAYMHDRTILRQLSEMSLIEGDQRQFQGLTVDGQNIIQRTYANLLAHQQTDQAVALVAPV